MIDPRGYNNFQRHFVAFWASVLILALMTLSCEDNIAPEGPCPPYNSVDNCSNTCVGLIPLLDLGSSTYLGFPGGLYPDGSNFRPATHNAAGVDIAAQIQPLNGSGIVDTVSGRIVMLSIGMSNAMQEFEYFQAAVNALPNKNPALTVINGAQGGKDIDQILDLANDFWDVLTDTLAARAITDAQVQVIWFKEAEAHPIVGPTFPGYPNDLKVRFKEAMNVLRARFPNAKLCYLASRIYGNYGTTPLNLEPFAWYTGWSVKWLIEDQINGDPDLVYNGTDPNSPWLSWGVYLWADGTNPRSDGLTWICPDDYDPDGAHPSIIGREKVAAILMNFFTTDETTTPWFLE